MGLITDIAAADLPEDGVVASSVYANGQRIADISIDEAGAWSEKDGHVVWIGLWEPEPRTSAPGPETIPPARPRHRGCRAPAPAAEARAIWRRALHRRAHRPAHPRPRLLRRDASLRRQGLYRQRAPRHLDLLRDGQAALGDLPDGARQGRGFHPLCHPRLHRRQLHAGAGADPGGGRRDRGPRAGKADDRRRHRAPLHAAARPAPPAQRGRSAGRGLPQARPPATCRRSGRPCTIFSAT